MWRLLFLSLLALPLSWGQLNKEIKQDFNRDAFSYFHTRPDIEAPKWSIKTYDAKALAQNPKHYWFIAPYQQLAQKSFPMWNGPFIYSTDGELVWAGPSQFDYYNIQDFHMVEVNGTQMLSFIYTNLHREAGRIMDKTYSLYKSVDITTIPNHPHPNMHEFNIINDGKSALAPTHLRTMKKPSPEAGVDCSVNWEGFIERDIATGEKLFEWTAFGHIDMDESAASSALSAAEICQKRRNWDALHMNAVDKFPDGDYLISVRNTDTLYKISHVDGHIVWRLGGHKSDFDFLPDARFSRQHHARVQSQNETHIVLSVFNNAANNGWQASEIQTDHSAALLLALNLDKMTAEVVTKFTKPFWHKEDFFDSRNKTKIRGSFQILDNGNGFVGWVDSSHISEHAPDGRLLQQAILLKREADSYRSYKMPWIGLPANPPDAIAEAIGMPGGRRVDTVVHVSWNGATEVASWSVFNVTRWGGSADTSLTTQRKTGFETTITLAGMVDRIIVVALDAEGEELGRTGIITTHDRAGLVEPGYSYFSVALFGAAVLATVVFTLRFCRRYNVLKVFRRRKTSWKGAEGDGLLAADLEEEKDRFRDVR